MRTLHYTSTLSVIAFYIYSMQGDVFIKYSERLSSKQWESLNFSPGETGIRKSVDRLDKAVPFPFSNLHAHS